MSETSQPERLRKKKRPSLKYPVRIDDTAEAEKALAAARGELLLALGTDREPQVRAAIADAEAAVAACFEMIRLTAMPPDDYEALIDEHPPREDHPEDESWNAATLPPAAFLGSAPDYWSAEEWIEWLAETCSDGERIGLYNAAVQLNGRAISPTIPKDWMQILSSG